MIEKFKDKFFVHCILVVLVVYQSSGLSEASATEEDKFQLAKSYLCRYGYMNKNLCYFRGQKANDFLRMHAPRMRAGLILFQKMFNLTEDG